MKSNEKPRADLTQALVDQSPDAIIFADTKGTICVWNTAAANIFGFTENDALGASLNLIIPESFREAHGRGFERAIADGTTKYLGQALPTKSIRSDGEQIYVELSFAIVLDSDETVLGASAHAREITERFNKERADRKRLKELEEANRG